MHDNIHAIKALINAGFVRRCHTVPCTDPQTTGHHSFEVALLVQYIYPECTKAALLRALTHDSAESWVGDTPGNAKWASAPLTAALQAMEDEYEAKHGIDYDLSLEEGMAVKCADLISLLLYTDHMLAMGNTYFLPFRDRIEKWFLTHPQHVAAFPKVKEFL